MLVETRFDFGQQPAKIRSQVTLLDDHGVALALASGVKTAAKIAIATAAFGIVHSLLASTRAKDAVRARLPRGGELYRAMYNVQAVVTFGALAAYISAQPSRTLYQIDGAGRVMLRVGQGCGIAFAVAAARATGVLKMTGIEGVADVFLGAPAHAVPVAQGPELDEETGRLRIRGPFTISRHPLNLAPLIPFWLTPHLTTRLLVFNLVGTVYLVLGSLHEERRLSAVYGEEYSLYRESGVPFYLPRLQRLLRK